ncbi:MAG TPA: ANTAR domain-containing protein [Actinomycetales bacterium]
MTEKSELLARLATIVADDAARRPLTMRLCRACLTMLGGDGASITVEASVTDRVTLCATDDDAAALEDLQEVLGEGPGKDAYRSGVAVQASLGDDADAHDRWPRFTRAARERIGGGVLYALPMRPGPEVLGVLSVYLVVPRPLRLPSASAQFLSDTVGAALLRDPLSTQDAEHSGAWAGRSQIHQATGMVVAQLGLPVQDALAILRAHAFAHDMTMADLAREVVERRYDFRGE